MAKVTRKVIRIDEELCNGCGQCVPSCAEGAIQIIEGKARLVSDKYCDGLGACLGECPMGALSFEEREAEEFDEKAVFGHLNEIGRSVEDHIVRQAQHAQNQHAHHGGCPGSRMFDFTADTNEEAEGETVKQRSQLRQWPVKLNLVNPSAPYFRDADLVLAADCAAFACGSFHSDYMKGKAIAIGCPKFDDVNYYIEKLKAIIEDGGVKSIAVVHMEVPCCMGLLYAAEKAVEMSERKVPIEEVVISIRGEVQDAPMFSGLR